MESIYRALMMRRRAANLARREGEKTPCPVVSVGNLTTGGTGKTPIVQWLARALQNDGWRVGVAARGYGGALSGQGALVSDGKATLTNVAEAGDEAILHARSLPGVIVAIAKNRSLAVELCAGQGAQIAILDDGFQFWSLPRAFDIVLLDAKNPFGNGHLLPRGRLREEKAALSRASAIVLTRCKRASALEIEETRKEIETLTDALVFTSNHTPQALRNEKTGEVVDLSFLERRDVKALAGLADNTQFYDSLQKMGVGHITRLRREHGDHHVWQKNDLNWFQNAPAINSHQAEIFEALPVITTEKDAVKLNPAWFDGPLFSLCIALKIDAPNAILSLIRAQIGSAPSSPL